MRSLEPPEALLVENVKQHITPHENTRQDLPRYHRQTTCCRQLAEQIADKQQYGQHQKGRRMRNRGPIPSQPRIEMGLSGVQLFISPKMCKTASPSKGAVKTALVPPLIVGPS